MQWFTQRLSILSIALLLMGPTASLAKSSFDAATALRSGSERRLTASNRLEAPWHYQYRHLTAPRWPYPHEQTHELLVTLPNLCFDRIAKVLRTPAVHLLLAKAASTPFLSRKLHETRHTSLRLRIKPMIQDQGMMLVLEHRSFSAQH